MIAFIINYNRLTLTVRMATWLSEWVDPVIVDNNSDYGPLLDYYTTSPFPVIRIPENIGSRVLWKTDILDRMCPGELYVATDPDLDPTELPDDWLDVLTEGIEKYDFAQKSGVSLRIDDLPDTDVARQAIEWERPHWAYPLDDGRFYKASIATTLAVCKNREDTFDAVRAAPPYCVRHIPWYYTPQRDLPEDELHYMRSVEVGKWNYWTTRLREEMAI